MGNVITTANSKGGVGKTTVTRLIAETLVKRGKSVCIIDMCQNSSIATGFLNDREQFTKTTYDWLIGEAKPSEVIQKHSEMLHFIPSNEQIDDFRNYANKLTMKKRLYSVDRKVKALRNVYDYILIDTHPSENDDLVAYSFVASDYVVVPFEVDEDSRVAVNRTIEIVKDFLQEDIKGYYLLPNKVNVTNQKINQQLQNMIESFKEKGVKENQILDHIRFSTTVSTSKNEKISLEELAQKNQYARKVVNDFDRVTDTIISEIEGSAV
ncbi:ParA family protein [Alkalicoccus luteus]|uniref:ParA family protein n=1 Tax=Alkalicoccus luteus TaxID=1237094 RepID=A0A969PR98_9BACI|nr:ParA family protein [Alkalicoccus luteus]NJP38966.1 ParA family protein [Alkalicoccus luteus]